MIRLIKIKNFKNHKNTSILLSNLTIFCGSNSVGKSSVFQPLLLLRESYKSKNNFDYLELLTDSIKIGNVQDALFENADNNSIEFEITTDVSYYKYCYTIKNEGNLKNYIDKDPNFIFEQVNKIDSLFNYNFQYISSSRLGPQNSYEKNDIIVEKHKQISFQEGKAEYGIHYLYENQNQKVLKELINTQYFGDTLINQVTAWEREISEGVIVKIDDLGKLGFNLSYQYETDSLVGQTIAKAPINVGFGLSYVLPILIAILSAKKDSLIIIENPEAHLHPNGISKLIELICKASQAGIQIILETHSDHIINGVLVQCKNFEDTSKTEGISLENVSLYQFSKDNQQSSIASKIEINEGGTIKYAPKGFFDQFTIDRKQLLGL